MKAIPVLFLLTLLAVQQSRAEEKEPSIVFDNHPEVGLPREAEAQMDEMRKEKNVRAKRPSKEDFASWPPSLHELTAGTIKTIRIRYYDKNTWKSEEEVREYVRGFFAHKSSEAFSSQVWSQGVGMPELECLIDFTDEYRKKLRAADKPCDEGRLVVWNTVSCFRDATGFWWFVTSFDHFHAAHPQGNRDNVKPAKPK